MNEYSIPLKIINLISDGQFHSSKELAKELGISRVAVNNHILTVRMWGLNVYTVIGKGHSLDAPLLLLNRTKIISCLDYPNILILPIVDSTNQYLLEHMDSLSSGDVCIAEYQKAGRGRRNRVWFSPFGVNLYLSMYWCLERGLESAVGMSLAIGVVIAETIQSLGVSDVQLKWPNDLYCKDRKLAGILVEFASKRETITHLVIGVGINLLMKTRKIFGIDDNWVNLQELGIYVDRNELAAKIINNLRKNLLVFERKGLEPFILRWKTLDNCVNRPVKLIIGNLEIYGISRGIDKQGSILIENNGKVKSWAGGDISLRLNS